MNIYEFIIKQKSESCLQELGNYLQNKYKLQGDVEYFNPGLGFDTFLNRYEISIDKYKIAIYGDNEIYISDYMKNNNYEIGKIKKDIITFLKYYKRREILKELI